MKVKFAGSDYVAERDEERLTTGLERVYNVLRKDAERWFTLETLAAEAGVRQSSVGSYLSYVRRDYHYEVPKRYLSDGLYEYKLGKSDE